MKKGTASEQESLPFLCGAAVFHLVVGFPAAGLACPGSTRCEGTVRTSWTLVPGLFVPDTCSVPPPAVLVLAQWRPAVQISAGAAGIVRSLGPTTSEIRSPLRRRPARTSRGRVCVCDCGTEQHRLSSKKDDPNHLTLRCNTLPAHRFVLVTSDCAHYRDLELRDLRRLPVQRPTGVGDRGRCTLAVGEAAIPLHPPPSPFSRCFNTGGEGVSAE